LTEPADLNRALGLYLGYNQASHPQTDACAVRAEFGIERGHALCDSIVAVVGEVGSITLDWNSYSLVEGTVEAKRMLREGHPEPDERGIDALGWRFSYNWK
jgi:hypothetical protein